MTKRVLKDISMPGEEPFWVFIPTTLTSTRPARRDFARYVPQAKAFANPRSWGYGGGETPWPFDYNKAMRDARYRTGIRNAIHSNWTASNWQYAAKLLLLEVLEELIACDDC